MEKHDLHHEFPQFDEKIHQLKVTDIHFSNLFDQYHEVNKDIQRVESGAEVAADSRLNELRLKRVHLKDELYAMLIK
jgi:hypothetical protein